MIPGPYINTFWSLKNGSIVYWVKPQSQPVKGENGFLISRKHSCESISSLAPSHAYVTQFKPKLVVIFLELFSRESYPKIIFAPLAFYILLDDYWFFSRSFKTLVFSKGIVILSFSFVRLRKMILSSAMGLRSRQTCSTDHILNTPWVNYKWIP